MTARIDSIYYFDYTKEIGFFDSIRNFTALEMSYIGMAISTEKIRVNSTPTSYKICTDGTNQIRQLAISRKALLKEISAELAINSPRYILIWYLDDTKQYFEYDDNFCQIFSMAKQFKIKNDENERQTQNPYVPSKNETLNSNLTPRQTQNVFHPQTNHTLSDDKNKGNFLNKLLVWILLFTALIFTVIILVGIDDKSNQIPITEPMSGTILSGKEVYDGSEITITASSGESCVVKLKTSTGTTRLSFFVRAGETVTVRVPAEYLYIYFASGDTWYGEEQLFGEYTSYSMDDEIRDFTQYTWEYTLYPINDGNFSETPIDASDF